MIGAGGLAYLAHKIQIWLHYGCEEKNKRLNQEFLRKLDKSKRKNETKLKGLEGKIDQLNGLVSGFSKEMSSSMKTLSIAVESLKRRVDSELTKSEKLNKTLIGRLEKLDKRQPSQSHGKNHSRTNSSLSLLSSSALEVEVPHVGRNRGVSSPPDILSPEDAQEIMRRNRPRRNSEVLPASVLSFLDKVPNKKMQVIPESNG